MFSYGPGKMTGKSADIRLNGANGFAVKTVDVQPAGLWKKIQINEWTFSLFLFVISLSIVLGKLCINYGYILQQQSNTKYTAPSVTVFSNTPNSLGILSVPDLPESYVKKFAVASEKFVNISNQYEEVVANAVMTVTQRYGWLIRAALCGLIMMGFTWFIIYNDSSVPGVNPPSPFSPSKHRLPEAPRLQINYLVGVLNGILIFVYMCL